MNRLLLLRHVIDDQGIHADPEKIQGIQDWHTPKSKNQLQTFIGVVIYHAQFFPHLATASVPLLDLLSQNEFKWRPCMNVIWIHVPVAVSRAERWISFVIVFGLLALF